MHAGFTKPTLVQARAIPLALRGKDICASAVTGSGKTLGFMVPVLERLLFKPSVLTRVLVLVLACLHACLPYTPGANAGTRRPSRKGRASTGKVFAPSLDLPVRWYTSYDESFYPFI